jgi:DeoR/GlpR family transcriptional regulator of sugar metabolism
MANIITGATAPTSKSSSTAVATFVAPSTPTTPAEVATFITQGTIAIATAVEVMKSCPANSGLYSQALNFAQQVAGMVLDEGVKIANASGKRIPFSLRSHENSPQKKQIAKAAAALIHTDDVVFLDGSSSAYFVAELLPAIGGVTVITNSIDAMSCLSRYDIKAYCTGGNMSPENKAVLTGDYTIDFLRKIHADVAIFSVQAVCSNGEFYDCYSDEVAIRNIMIKNASKRILLCDSSKLDKTSTFYQGCADDVDHIISDRDLSTFFTDPIPEKYIRA